jgi:ELWxxDGT repeat protein
MVRDIMPGKVSSNPNNLTVMEGNLYFTAIIREGPSYYRSDGIRALWKMNGSSENVERLKTISFLVNAGTEDEFEEPMYAGNFTVAGNSLYFSTELDSYENSTLWKTNGTTDGTVALKDFVPYDASSGLSNFINIDGTLFFRWTEYNRQADALWKSDGTVAGTQSVGGGYYGRSHSFTKMNNTLYFISSDISPYSEERPDELWRSDGTRKGTVLVHKGPQVVNFALVNADTNEDIEHFWAEGGDVFNYVIDYARLPTHNLSIRATTVGKTGSVVFWFNRKQVQIENHAPYAIAGDDPQGDYNPWPLPVGNHTLQAIPYSRTWGKGLRGMAHTVNLTVVGHKITGFTLVNADTDEDIGTLENGSILDLSALPTQNLNIRAEASPAAVGSVVFKLNRKEFTENNAPFALFGNTGNDYKAGALPVGNHTLVATPYTNGYGKGMKGQELSVAFQVVSGVSGAFSLGERGEGALLNRAQEAYVSVSPNPVRDQATVEFSVPVTGRVDLDIYDLTGKLIHRLYAGQAEAGAPQAFKFEGKGLPRGVYVARLLTGWQVLTRKIVLAE